MGERDAANAGEIQWSDCLSVGIPEIDADHRVLIELIAQIEKAVGHPDRDAVVGTVLAALADYTEYHFSREERMLEAVGYPDHQGHLRRHAELQERLTVHLRRHGEDPASLPPEDLCVFLRQWVLDHIVKDDIPYAACCAGDPQAHEAVRSVGEDVILEAQPLETLAEGFEP